MASSIVKEEIIRSTPCRPQSGKQCPNWSPSFTPRQMPVRDIRMLFAAVFVGKFFVWIGDEKGFTAENRDVFDFQIDPK